MWLGLFILKGETVAEKSKDGSRFQGRIALHFGALCHPIAKQLKDAKVRFSKADAEVWQKNADAITMLRIHGLLPDSASRAAHKRLMKKIVSQIEAFAPRT